MEKDGGGAQQGDPWEHELAVSATAPGRTKAVHGNLSWVKRFPHSARSSPGLTNGPPLGSNSTTALFPETISGRLR